jgi:plasmid stabilization system protein ParE
VTVSVSGPARRDLQRLHDWLAAVNPSAADKAIDAITRGILSLEDFAERGRPITAQIRELKIEFGRYGYVLRYWAQDGDVIITRVFHGRERRP